MEALKQEQERLLREAAASEDPTSASYMGGGDVEELGVDELRKHLVECQNLLLQKDQQILVLTSDLSAASSRLAEDASRYTEVLAAQQAVAISAKRQLDDLKKRFRTQEGRVGNLEDSIDALSGRLESEINRAEKLNAQNVTMRKLLDKQTQTMQASDPSEHLAAAVAANEKVSYLENKILSLEADHRTTQSKLTRAMEKRMKHMQDSKSALESKVDKLNNLNKRLLMQLDAIRDNADSQGVMLPGLDEHMMGVEETDMLGASDFHSASMNMSPTSHQVPIMDPDEQRAPTGDFSTDLNNPIAISQRNSSAHLLNGGGAGGDDDDGDDDILRPSSSRTSGSKSSRRKSPSPSPFRRFMPGRRAKSPHRSMAGKEGSSNTPATPSNSVPRRRKSFKNYLMNNGTVSTDDVGGAGGNASSKPGQHEGPSSQVELKDESDSKAMKKRRASLSALAGRKTSASAGPGATMSEQEEAALIRERRETAAKRQAARMQAVRSSNQKGSWGFSV